jgi:cytochrome d ubiquinol oxidase subunit II
VLPELFAGVILAALVLYALLGGADFGGGVWDLLARGPRAADQRRVIERAIAPVWEANHVWLILAVVMLFTAFPPAFSAIAIDLHVPLVLMLVGIVLRGSAFVFRQYGDGGRASTERWGRVFAIASTVTPVVIGVTVGAITTGARRASGVPPSTLDLSWLGGFELLVGLFTLALFAFLAAAYLTVEAETPELRDDFRARAIGASLSAGGAGGRRGARRGPRDHALRRPPHRIVVEPPARGADDSGRARRALSLLFTRRFGLARVVAGSQVVLVLLGWGAAQYPVLVAPDLTIASAAAPAATLEVVWPVLIAGSVLLFPSLYWMLRVFKAGQR